MENGSRTRKVHCVVLAYPHQGHINPMLQFSKRLQHDGVRVTLVTTRFCCKTNVQKLDASISVESISDGFDNGGFAEAESVKAYIDRFWEIGPPTFSELLEKLISSGNLVDCVVYDSFMPWALDIAKKFGLIGAAFLTQPLAVNCVYHHVHQGNLKLPLLEHISLPGLPHLQPCELPSFLYIYGSYPASFDLVVGSQFSNIEKADWVLCNTFYELEEEAADWLSKIWPMLRTIGPTMPSMFLDKKVKDDNDYGFNLFKTEECVKWMDDNKPKGSIVYVSFGSFSVLTEEQMHEVAFGLQASGCYFLWVVRASEESKIPIAFLRNSEKGLVLTWCSQLKVLEHEALGCFVTHCGWNSTLEALSLGVPMIAMPQWTDQPTNAKLIEDVWKIGLRVPTDDEGIFRREALKHCITEIMDSERGRVIKRNATKWKILATKAVDEDGSSHLNIGKFVSSLAR